MPPPPTTFSTDTPTPTPMDSSPSVSHREFEINYAKCHQHRRNYRRIHQHIHRRILVLRHLTKSSKTFTTKCHNHQRPYRRITIRRYLTESSKLITRNATNTDGFTDTYTDFSSSVSHREFENNYNKMPPSPTTIPT